jgi:hypothetical protein
MSVNQRPKVAYSLSQPYFNASPLPIITTRDPFVSDFAEIGTIWINQTTPTAWLLAEIVLNQAVWIEIDNTAAPLGIVWHNIAGVGPQALAANNGYYLQNAAAVALTLPAVATLGSQIYIATFNASAVNAGFTIAQNAAQYIVLGNDVSTPGVGGSLAAIDDRQASITMQLICTIANTEFTVFNTNVNPHLI